MKKNKNFSIKELINTDKDIEMVIKPKRQFNNNSTSDFFAQYKDPRWQKKRLKIMERDEFMCVSCQDKDSTLNVHHSVLYRKNTKPWDYEDDELVTLCESCHKELTAIIKTCNSIVMSRCYTVGFAGEFLSVMERLDGMNPYDLMKVWKMIDILKML